MNLLDLAGLKTLAFEFLWLLKWYFPDWLRAYWLTYSFGLGLIFTVVCGKTKYQWKFTLWTYSRSHWPFWTFIKSELIVSAWSCVIFVRESNIAHRCDFLWLFLKITYLEYRGVYPFLWFLLIYTNDAMWYVSGEGLTCSGFLP